MKQFIRNVRAAKTIADERAVVQKESAAIRASFREESHYSNVRWVVKLGRWAYVDVCAGETMSRNCSISSPWASGRTLARLNV